MIECDTCQEWFHGSCVGVTEGDAKFMETYACPDCESAGRGSTNVSNAAKAAS